MASPDKLQTAFESVRPEEFVNSVINDLADRYIPGGAKCTPWLSSGNIEDIDEGNHPDFSAQTRIRRDDSGSWHVEIVDRKVAGVSRHYETRLDKYWQQDGEIYGQCYRFYRPQSKRVKVNKLSCDLDGATAVSGLYYHLLNNMPRSRRELLDEFYDRFPDEYGNREKSRYGDQSLVKYHRLIRRGSTRMRFSEFCTTLFSPNLDKN